MQQQVLLLRSAEEPLRVALERLLHRAWGSSAPESGNMGSRATISQLLGLAGDVPAAEEKGDDGRWLRSGRRRSRVLPGGTPHQTRWVIWQENSRCADEQSKGGGGEVVGALVLLRQKPRTVTVISSSSSSSSSSEAAAAGGAASTKRLPGGMVMEYIAADTAKGGKGWPMVRAALEICKGEGLKELFSACDLTQKGRGRAGWSPCRSAAEAHKNWGFVEIGKASWTDGWGLEPYSPEANVLYMCKTVPAEAAATVA